MANTFKFGTNGNWAVKDGQALAYNDENNNFKPLPFDFTRASSATRVNKQGLIETVGSGKPRIDFTDNTDGHLLLEPSRTNIITHSEDFNQWTKLGTTFTITSNNQISPSGELNASTVNVTNNDNILYKSVSGLGSSTSNWNFTIYAKGSGTFDMNIRLNTSTTTTETKTLTSSWQRFNVSVTGTPTINSVESYVQFNTSGTYYIWGAQTEAGSYATSYIPTEGSSVTRVADSTSQTAPDGIIGQTEGTVFLEIKAPNKLANGGRTIFVIGDSPNIVYISKDSSTLNTFQLATQSPSGFNFINTSEITTDEVKLAIGYKNGDNAFYVNGSLISSESSVTNPNLNSKLLLGNSTASLNTDVRIKDFRVYNTRLSNAELQALTS